MEPLQRDDGTAANDGTHVPANGTNADDRSFANDRSFAVGTFLKRFAEAPDDIEIFGMPGQKPKVEIWVNWKQIPKPTDLVLTSDGRAMKLLRYADFLKLKPATMFIAVCVYVGMLP
jgi:hypothetical protein